MEKKFRCPLYSKLAFSAAGVLLAVCLIEEALQAFDCSLYLFGVGGKTVVLWLVPVIAVLVISAVAVLLIRSVGHRVLVAIGAVGVSVVVFVGVALSWLVSMDSRYFTCVSDDGKHTLVVDEQAFLLAGWGDLYEKTSFCTMKKIGDYTTDDGYRPFSNGTFYFVWEDEGFELHYYFGAGGMSEYSVVTARYA